MLQHVQIHFGGVCMDSQFTFDLAIWAVIKISCVDVEMKIKNVQQCCAQETQGHNDSHLKRIH